MLRSWWPCSAPAHPHQQYILVIASFALAAVALQVSRCSAANQIPQLSTPVEQLAMYGDSLIAATRINLYRFVVKQWTGDGWVDLGVFSKPAGIPYAYADIHAMLEYGGLLVVAGSFTTVNGDSIWHLAVWDGNTWSDLGGRARGNVYAMTLFEDDLVVGGAFSRIGDIEARNIARWDGSSWSPVVYAGNRSVVNLTVWDGKLVAGLGGRIKVLEGDTWTEIGRVSGGWMDFIEVLDTWEGKLLAGGDFTAVGGIKVNRIGCWDGTGWTGLGTGVGPRWVNEGGYDGEFGTVYDFIHHGGMLIAAGEFHQGSIARWDGAAWSRLGCGTDGRVYTLLEWDGRLLVGGSFSEIFCRSYSNLAVKDFRVRPLPRFECVSLDSTVRLSWTNPEDEAFAGVLIRFGEEAFPDTPDDGYPVPNGNDGRFEGSAGSDSSFIHSRLLYGKKYCYCAWAYDTVGTYSSLVRTACRILLLGPPLRFEAIAGVRSVTLEWTNSADERMMGTKILYSTEGFPTDPRGDQIPGGHSTGRFDGEPGSDSSFTHEPVVVGWTYYYSAFTYDSLLNYSHPVNAAAAPVDVEPVVDFTASPGDRFVLLKWTHPFAWRFKGTLVRFATDDYPADPLDGAPVSTANDGRFEGPAGSDTFFVHPDLENGVTYYYSAFSYNVHLRYSYPVNASAVPEDSGALQPLAQFKATAAEDGILLEWIYPPDADLRGALIHYSRTGYPADTLQGSPVENENSGRFEGEPNADSSFLHLTSGGVPYYYSAWAYSEGFQLSPVSHASALRPVDTLRTFHAIPGDGEVHLLWNNPWDSDYAATLIRFSTVAFPESPGEGQPVPNGNEGRFEGRNGMSDYFKHTGLDEGIAYYYTAFVELADPERFSVPVKRNATTAGQADHGPPGVVIAVMQNPVLSQYLDIYAIGSGGFHYGFELFVAGEPMSLRQVDEAEHVWMCDYRITDSGGLKSIVACAANRAGRDTCMTSIFMTKLVAANRGSTVSSPDGHLMFHVGPDAVFTDSHVLVLPCKLRSGPGGSGQPGYRNIIHLADYESTPEAYHVTPVGLLCGGTAQMVFDYAALDLEWGISPDELNIELVGVGLLPSYVDPERHLVSAQVERLGTFRLVAGGEGSSSLIDPAFLEVGPGRPMPFTAETRVRFGIRACQHVRATVYDTGGRRLVCLLDKVVGPGFREIVWNGTMATGQVAPTGVYFIKIETPRSSAARKLLLIR